MKFEKLLPFDCGIYSQFYLSSGQWSEMSLKTILSDVLPSAVAGALIYSGVDKIGFMEGGWICQRSARGSDLVADTKSGIDIKKRKAPK